MTATLNELGEIVLPLEANEAARLRPGEQFEVSVSLSRDILLRRERKRRRTLLEHFEAMRGFTIERRRDVIPPPPVL